MKLTKRKLRLVIESFLFEKEAPEQAQKKEYDFGESVEVNLNDGSTVKFESSDTGGVTVKLTLPSGKEEDPITITNEDVENNTESKDEFSKSAGGVLRAMARDGLRSELEKILKKLNDLIDITPVLKLRSALVHYDSLILTDSENSSSARHS